MALSDNKNGTAAPCPANFNLARYVLAAVDETPEKTALEVLRAPGDVALRLSFAQLRDRVLTTATGLQDLGVTPGGKVVLRLGNDVTFPLAYLAAAALGAIPVATATALTLPEFETLMGTLDDVALIVSDDVTAGAVPVCSSGDIWAMGALAPARYADTRADDPGYMVFTSGSSGQPKGVVHAHRAVWARRMMWDDWYGLRRQDRMLHAGALNWTYTLGTGLMDPWARGATALVFGGVAERHVWPALIAAHRPTIFAAAPGVFRQIAEARVEGLAAQVGSLRHVLSAGDTLTEPVRTAFETQSGLRIYGALGMSEVSTYVSQAPGQDGDARPQRGRRVAVLGDDGLPVPLGDEGELAVHRSDPGLMLGYHRRGAAPELPLTGEWFRTGDKARMVDDGSIAHLGRVDDVMNAGGYRVAPLEVEAALQACPGVDDLAVASVEVRDGVWVIAAFYVGTDVNADDLTAFAAAHLARYKQPRAFVRVDALPRRANGKLARKELPGLWTKT